MKAPSVIATLALVLTSVVAGAHHSFSVFNTAERVEITGTVQKVQWTNPHIWIWVDVKGADGSVTTWGLEGMSPNFLARRGWSRTTLKSGDAVTVTLNPLRSGEPGGMFISTVAPDGTILSMGGGKEGESEGE